MKSFFLTTGGMALMMSLAVPALAQQSGTAPAEHMDAHGMPTNRSTPAEKAVTAGLNKQQAASAAQTNGEAASAEAQYQVQEKEYQEQLRQNRKAQADYQSQKAAYDAEAARYQALRAQSAAKPAQ